mmetsp:Transcript_2047/g.2906  ORF Transcript_2047/g.2906 Transcript_2047/m.2906 type:complete len:80 (-) Transcript_2047:238-477(-)
MLLVKRKNDIFIIVLLSLEFHGTICMKKVEKNNKGVYYSSSPSLFFTAHFSKAARNATHSFNLFLAWQAFTASYASEQC